MAVTLKQGQVISGFTGIVMMIFPAVLLTLELSLVRAERITKSFYDISSLENKFSLQAAIQKERRTALVIGNSNYSAEGKLNNPRNDSADMDATLRGLGFDVKLLQDANKKQMKEAIDQFTRQLRQGEVGLFYYAGHGVQVKGENYLIPIGADISREQDVEYEAVPLDNILQKMEATKGINIVLIDACRSNPYSRGWRSIIRGLAFTQSIEGTFISFSAAPGQQAKDGDGRNSPYTASLLQYIQRPGLPLALLFQQVRQSVREKTNGAQTPWESSSLTGNFAFKPTESGSSKPAEPFFPPTPPSTNISSQMLISQATGISYTKLRDFLTAQNWAEADKETTQAILKASGRTAERTLTREDIYKISCEDLRIIDQLWITASNKKFGFSIQSHIYQSLGGIRKYDEDTWRRFGIQVGWRNREDWLPYSDYVFNVSDAPSGHFPSILTFLSEGGGYRRGERIGDEESGLIHLFSQCGLKQVK